MVIKEDVRLISGYTEPGEEIGVYHDPITNREYPIFQPRLIVAEAPENVDTLAVNRHIIQFNTNPKSATIELTGRAPRTIQPRVREAALHGLCTLQHATVFNLDELATPSAHPGSYHSHMRKYYFDGLPYVVNWFIPNGDAADLATEAWKYQYAIDYQIKHHGPFDVAFVSYGPEGKTGIHVGFNEPDENSHPHSLARVIHQSPETVAVNAPEFRNAAIGTQFEDYPYPEPAITMGMDTLVWPEKTAEIFMIRKGAINGPGLNRMLVGDPGMDCPASFTRLHPNLNIVIDRDLALTLPEAILETFGYDRAAERFIEDEYISTLQVM